MEVRGAAGARHRFNVEGHLRSLQEFVDHEHVSRLTKQDIVSWKDKLVQDGMAAKTITC